MIYKIQQYKFKCDNCDKEEIFYNGYLKYFESARRKGWAVSRDKTYCYCPQCAHWYRNSGKKSVMVITPESKRKLQIIKESRNKY